MDNAVAPQTDIGHPADVQFLCSRRIQDGEGEVFEAGHLAVCWLEQQVGPERHQLLTEETSLAWKALRATNRPAIVESTQGRRISGMRIGPAAHDLVTSSEMLLTRGGVQRLHLAAAPPTGQIRDRLYDLVHGWPWRVAGRAVSSGQTARANGRVVLC
ncbi:hypothetical protein AB0K09_28125 [Streptomyces sp. NPDC049577]|uniref:hypothetical protein n=1 Tax=Streptomyces sp. NPDC049577 TaxID=3155153 RepID=UPI003426B033